MQKKKKCHTSENHKITLLLFLIFIRWYCHLDDDMYLNVQNLLQLLDTLDPLSTHYLGKRSINTRIDVRERERRGTEKREYSFLNLGQRKL